MVRSHISNLLAFPVCHVSLLPKLQCNDSLECPFPRQCPIFPDIPICSWNLAIYRGTKPGFADRFLPECPCLHVALSFANVLGTCYVRSYETVPVVLTALFPPIHVLHGRGVLVTIPPLLAPQVRQVCTLSPLSPYVSPLFELVLAWLFTRFACARIPHTSALFPDFRTIRRFFAWKPAIHSQNTLDIGQSFVTYWSPPITLRIVTCHIPATCIAGVCNLAAIIPTT